MATGLLNQTETRTMHTFKSSFNREAKHDTQKPEYGILWTLSAGKRTEGIKTV